MHVAMVDDLSEVAPTHPIYTLESLEALRALETASVSLISVLPATCGYGWKRGLGYLILPVCRVKCDWLRGVLVSSQFVV